MNCSFVLCCSSLEAKCSQSLSGGSSGIAGNRVSAWEFRIPPSQWRYAERKQFGQQGRARGSHSGQNLKSVTYG